MFVKSFDATIPQETGGSYAAEGYTFAFAGFEETQENVQTATGQGDAVYTLKLDLAKNGRALKQLEPQIRAPQQLRQQNSTTQHVAIWSEAFKDIFVSFAGIDPDGNASIVIKFFPMQSWVWVGFGITIIGTALAAWPKRLKAA
jgi:cytochrome c-type biogenesis protein CcmF